MINLITATAGLKVIRKASEKDYTNGRRGEVLEIDLTAGRVRVLWTNEKDGSPVLPKPIRTWVNGRALLYA